MRVVSFPESQVPRDLRVQMMALQHQAWPSEGPADPSPWHDPGLDPVSILLLDDEERVVAALDILSKELVHEGATYRASGISAMVTDHAMRRRGYGRALARAAGEAMESAGADLGLFTCDEPLVAFYASAGWEHLPGTVLVGGTPEEPFPSDVLGKATMARFFSDRAAAARDGFVGARVDLFPGRIDRLW